MANQIKIAAILLVVSWAPIAFLGAKDAFINMVNDPCNADWVMVARGDEQAAIEMENQCRADQQAWKEYRKEMSDNVADVYGGL